MREAAARVISEAEAWMRQQRNNRNYRSDMVLLHV